MANHSDSGGHDLAMSAEPPERLTPREQQVATLVADGLEIKEIGRELGICYHTTKMHLRSAKGKLGVRNQIELALTMHGYTPRCLRSA